MTFSEAEEQAIIYSVNRVCELNNLPEHYKPKLIEAARQIATLGRVVIMKGRRSPQIRLIDLYSTPSIPTVQALPKENGAYRQFEKRDKRKNFR